jgi:hypothetical protein
MSLKAFHVLFVILSVTITVFFGVWALMYQPEGMEPISPLYGYGSLAASIGLIGYGVMFLQKIKREGL